MAASHRTSMGPERCVASTAWSRAGCVGGARGRAAALPALA